MRSSAHTRSQSRAKSFSFLPAHPLSTCSRATPTEAINSVPWCTPYQSKTMKLPQFLTRKRLHATTARRALGGTEMDFEEMSEPNMKLSRALLIVLVLHVVAVAGIIAFNAIKTRQGLPPPGS